jgi:hypothetical protein
MQKCCNRCARDLPLDEFHRRGGIQQSWCKDCRRAYDAEYWRRTRVARIKLRKVRQAELADWHRRLEEGRPCADCGGVFHHAAMHWDHLPGSLRRREVSTLVRRGFVATRSSTRSLSASSSVLTVMLHARSSGFGV